MTSRKTKVLRLASLGLVALLCVLLLKNLDTARLWRVLRSTDWYLVFLAAFLNLSINTLARALRFRVLLCQLPEGKTAISLWELFLLVLATRALSMLLPARGGEALRAGQLHGRYGYPVEYILAVLLIEPVIEGFSLGLPAVVLVFFFAVPAAISQKFYIVAGFTILLACLAISFAFIRSRYRKGRLTEPISSAKYGVTIINRLKSRIRSFLDAVQILNRPGLWGRALGWTWLADGIDLLTIGLCLSAVGLTMDIVNCFVILIAVNIAILLPVTPGNIGTLEAGAVFVLETLGAGQSEALAFALLYHATHLIPIVITGSIALQLQWQDR